jgi:hypothetical protein
MTHIHYNKYKLTSYGQWLMMQGRLGDASSIMNLLGFWGDAYAESIFQRIAPMIPSEYLIPA